ncbi:MAG: CoA transferase [Desulfobulbus sp.]|jgi:crotonobetainyl-CoA:carnitine CoA-transferase CaiB-like acyl-CoA transferase|uniref:CaiB/BaiF CoA transferase family protein n=1 Tax=Desulfobulbus sp. TaxID=895 RepID=UPI002842A2BB|nr:CaiB/BaiF CoA-transferase family protein [Desulfobulbus sp.]MDR2550370.1 CoA transferase [Desulfobulbus sp.]
MEAAFAGVKVLDVSRLLPGPFCSMLLADFGAEVVKVEDPGGGDYIRWWPPFLGKNSGFHVVLNRNKKSLTLNLKHPEGKRIFMRLAETADVVLEGFRPGVMDRLGLGYAALRAINPRLVYCAVTGYGADGPRALRAGHDINYLALNGVLSYSGRQGNPTLSGVQIADLGGGALYAAFAIATALFARERLGEGQYIDLAMADGALTWHCLRWGKYLADGLVPVQGDDFLNHGFACYNLYATRDGRTMSLGALEPQFWQLFCETVGRPEWNTSRYFEPGPHQRELQREVTALFLTRDLREWTELFAGADCCCEPVLNLDEVLADEQIRQRQMVVEMIHEAWGTYRQLGIAPKLSRTPGTIRGHAPELGEHTTGILAAMGIDAAEQAQLRAAKAI